MAASTAVLSRGPVPAVSVGALKAFAIRFRQKRPDVNLYVTSLPLKSLIGRFEADTYSTGNPRGYQRPVAQSRLRQISTYMRQEEGMLPTAIVFCIRQPHRADFEPAVGGNGGGGAGPLALAQAAPRLGVGGGNPPFGPRGGLGEGEEKWVPLLPPAPGH